MHDAQEPNQRDDCVIQLKGVSKRIGKIGIISDIDIEIKKGEITGILGESGSGKTTVLKTLCGITKPTTGEVVGKKFNRDKRLYHMGYTAQKNQFYDYLTVWENIEYFGMLYNISRERIKEIGGGYLKKTKMTGKENVIATNLSGGEKRRLNIILSMLHTPEVLFLDEPTSGLDITVRSEICNIIKDIATEGRTVVFTTHYLEEAEELCDKILLLKGGKSLAYGTVEGLMKRSGYKYKLVFSTDKEVKLKVYAPYKRMGTTYKVFTNDPKKTMVEISEMLNEQGIKNVSMHEYPIIFEDAFFILMGGKVV